MLTILSRPAPSLDACLRALGDLAPTDVLALTIFADAAATPDFAAQRAALKAEVDSFFGGEPPPASVVAQAPELPGHVAVEALIRAGGHAERRTHAGATYTIVTGRGWREVHGRDLASDPGLRAPAARSRSAFEKMEAILRREGMSFGHVVRQWAYLEGMLDVVADCARAHQGYQAFNDIRALAYAGSEFPTGYPAATGIGQAAGGVVLDFVALDAPGATITALSNPRQTDAHRYSSRQLVGDSITTLPRKSPPKFERAKRIVRGEEDIVLVSGTAAIVGERSVAPGDVAAQTETTIDNIAALVGVRRLSRLRAYVKHRRDIPVVRALCEDAFGPIPAVYVQADVCRPELLVELEGALITRRKV